MSLKSGLVVGEVHFVTTLISSLSVTAWLDAVPLHAVVGKSGYPGRFQMKCLASRCKRTSQRLAAGSIAAVVAADAAVAVGHGAAMLALGNTGLSS